MTLGVYEGDVDSYRDRVIWVIRFFAGKPVRYKRLEERFSIPARRWQNVCNDAQQPSLDMVAALAEQYPYFSQWMLTGKSKTAKQLNPCEPCWHEALSKRNREAVIKA